MMHMAHPRAELTLLAALGGAAAISLLSRPAPRRRRRATPTPHRVVVIGAGFGGLQAALRLARQRDVDLTVIDAHNHHLFQPLLYQVATAALSPADIASPLRGIIPASDRTHVLVETVTGVDTQARHVVCDGGVVPYDELIIATGSQVSYFGHEPWAAAAPGLKTLDDALDLRHRVLAAFEQASIAATEGEQAKCLTFVLIGAGPTGVEMAGSIAELARDMLARDYDMRLKRARIVLIEAGARVLEAFPPDLSQNAADALADLGVDIRTGTRVTRIESGVVHLGKESIPTQTVIWTAGTTATPVADWLGVAPGHGGRVPVDAALRVAGQPAIHVIGDAALAVDAHGKPLPGLAPVAKQQGAYVARAILRRLRGRGAPRPFSYRDYGNLATIGRNKAVAEFGPVHLTGFPAWLTWAAAHIFFLISFRNRVMVTAQWAFAYATDQRAGRLIIKRLDWRQAAGASPVLRRDQPPVANPG